jgi:uncharacterized protein (DUF488 family)
LSARRKTVGVALDTGGGRGTEVFTIGYSGHTQESFLAALRAAGVEQVLDVRSKPFSRKPGFSKGSLSQFLTTSGVLYVHLPLLGAPRELLLDRKAGKGFGAISKRYSSHLAKQGAALEEAVRLAGERPSVLMCLEKDPRECHRGVLATRFAARGWRVVHL